MLSRRNHELAERRQQLLLRSAELRNAFAHQSDFLKMPLALVDQLRVSMHWFGRYSVWPIGALTLLTLIRPRRMLHGLLFIYAASRMLLRTWNRLRGSGHQLANFERQPPADEPPQAS